MKNGDNIPMVRTKKTKETILGWPTDCVSIDYYNYSPQEEDTPLYPQTMLIFFPGNPGLVGWYVQEFEELVQNCGVGFAARLVSYAGHGITEDVLDVAGKNKDIAWTVDGQIDHKIAYMDQLVLQLKQQQLANNAHQQSTTATTPPPKFIFVGHSIGCYMIQRLLILRRDILLQTRLLLYVTPFIRMKPDKWKQRVFLEWGAKDPDRLIAVGKTLLRPLLAMSKEKLDAFLLRHGDMQRGRDITVELLHQAHHFVPNHYELGCEELRDVPEIPDVSAFRVIGKYCPTEILFAGDDQWAPKSHLKDIQDLQQKGEIPSRIGMTYIPELFHDYVVRPHMIAKVVQFYKKAIQTHIVVNSKEEDAKKNQ